MQAFINHQSTRIPVLTVMMSAFVCALFSFVSLGQANEIWVPPVKKDPNKEVGNWAVAKLKAGEDDDDDDDDDDDGGGEGTHFEFSVPDNLTSFTSAKVVVIPTTNGTLTYSLDISVGEDGDPQNIFTNSQSGLTAPVTKNELTEVDVSGIVPTSLLLPGQTYVTLRFEGETRVLGLRVQYEGPAGPQGDQGVQGKDVLVRKPAYPGSIGMFLSRS